MLNEIPLWVMLSWCQEKKIHRFLPSIYSSFFDHVPVKHSWLILLCWPNILRDSSWRSRCRFFVAFCETSTFWTPFFETKITNRTLEIRSYVKQISSSAAGNSQGIDRNCPFLRRFTFWTRDRYNFFYTLIVFHGNGSFTQCRNRNPLDKPGKCISFW